MTLEIRKPAEWQDTSFDELLDCQAGQAFVAAQLNGNVQPIASFRSSRSSSCSYDVFGDGSLWFHSNAEDEVWADSSFFVMEMDFGEQAWDDIDSMDRDLLTHLYGEEGAKEFFESRSTV